MSKLKHHGAIPEEVFDAMLFNLSAMCERRISFIPFSMTHREAMEIAASLQDVECLMHASSIAFMRPFTQNISIAVPHLIDSVEVVVHLEMRTHGENMPPFAPAHPAWQQGKGQKIVDWVQQRMELGRRFAVARLVLTRLNDVCTSGAQLRYIFPAVMNLAYAHFDLDNKTTGIISKWRDKHVAFKATAVPSVMPEDRELIRDASAIITSTMLLGEARPEEYGQVVPNCNANSTCFQCLGANLTRM